MYKNAICTDYMSMEDRIKIFKEINSIPLKSITKIGYLNKFFRDHKAAGRIYNLNSAKVAMFVRKAMKYFEDNKIRYQTDIFYYNKLDGEKWYSIAFQIIEKCMIYNNPQKYNLTKKELTGDCYHNLMLTYGPIGGLEKYEAKRNRVKGDKNPGYQHGGKLSAWSKNFVGGYDKEKHEKFLEKRREQLQTLEERVLNPAFFEYWLNVCDGDEEKAKEMHSNSQRRDINYFTEKYGEEEGRKRHADKTKKWIGSFPKTNFSVISQKLFDQLVKRLNMENHNIYYATFDREDKKHCEYNKEYTLNLSETTIKPDFIDLNSNKIIEFDGDYWHSENVANPEREKRRDELIEKHGYKVLHIKEYNYNKDQERVIQECLDFLKL